MNDELTQNNLEKECRYAGLDISDSSGPLIICTKKVGHKDKCLGIIDLCIASEMDSPLAEYALFSSSNHLPTMNKCEFKEPLTPDKERHTKRLYEQQMIYAKAARMQTKIDSEDIKIANDKDVEGMIALTIVNYLKSKNYETMNFKERLKTRHDIASKITAIAQNIEKNLEARV
jgi:hypothetical protein